MLGRIFSTGRPSQQSSSSQAWELEVFVIYKDAEKRPEKRPEKYKFKNGTGIRVRKLVEDLCEKLQILPINTALFGISYNKLGRRLYFPYTKVLMKEDVLKKKLTLRLQFKVDCTCMHGSDKNAFDYFLLQCRRDFVRGRYKDRIFQMQDSTEILLRMLILETLLLSKHENLPKKDGAKNLQKIIKRRHSLNIERILLRYIDDKNKNQSEEVKKCKKIIENSLPMFETVNNPEVDFVREVGFLPEYYKETFDNLKKVYGRNDVTAVDEISLAIDPAEGITRIRSIDKSFKKADDRTPFDKIDCLSVSKSDINADVPKFQLRIGKDCNQRLEVIESNSEEELLCICSWVDGYYRLFVDQYTSLLEARKTERKFHGPIGRSVCSQLMENISCTKGDFAIRESQEVYNKFLLTVKMKNDYKNYEIHHQPPDEYYIEEGQTFKKLEDLVNHYQHNEKKLELKRMIKPSSTGRVPFRSEFKPIPTMVSRAAPKASSLELQILDSKSIIRQELLSKGSFGAVWKCIQRRHQSSETVVVRYLSDEDLSPKAFEKLFNCCKEMVSAMIIRITGRSVSENPNYLAFEYMDGGPLDVFLKQQRDDLRYRTLLKYISSVAEGMMYLERDLKFVHGNLSCHNILHLSNGDIKISDACFRPILQQDGKLSKAEFDTNCNWSAPEVLSDGEMTHHSDSWSFGMTIWEMMALSKPFGLVSSSDVLGMTLQGTRPPFTVLPYCPVEIQEILMSCWNITPSDRNNFTEINHRLAVYRRGNEYLLKRGSLNEQQRQVFPVATYLLKRCYYKWKEEEASYEENRKKEVRAQREQMKKIWLESGSTAETNNVGDSSGSGSYKIVMQLDRSGNSSNDCGQPHSSTTSLSDGESCSLNAESDVEMTASDNVEGGSLLLSRSPILTIDSKNSPAADHPNLKSTISEYKPHGLEKDKPKIRRVSRSSKDIKDGNDRNKSDSIALMTFSKPGSPAEVEVESSSKNEIVTDDVMEIANVLASMAHHRKVDQSRQLNSSGAFSPYKKARRESPPDNRSTGTKEGTGSIADRGSCRENIDIGYRSTAYSNTRKYQDDMNGNESTSKRLKGDKEVHPMQRLVDSDDYEHSERKKRSHSVSKQISQMQKRAARRALNIPNPFNLGTNVPRNFLLSAKDPVVLSERSQPEEISKFFNNIPAKNTTRSLGQHERLTKQQFPKLDSSGYKTLSEIKQLEENFSSLKATSPGNPSSSVGASSKNSVSQSLAFVIPPNQQLGNQQTDQSNAQSSINAYLANLSQSFVAGNPVLLPQITVNATSGQSIASPAQLLQVLQAQQKLSQLAQSNCQEKSQLKSSSDGSMPLVTPDYLQTLLTIFASKNMHVSPSQNAQQSHYQQISVSTHSPRPIYATATAPVATITTNGSLLGKSHDQYKKVVDIKPKPVTSDSAKSDGDVGMIPVQNPIGQKAGRTSATSMSLLHSGDDSRAQVARPVSLRAMPSQRPILVDSKMPFSRPLFLKRDSSPQTVRAQHLILPKNLPEQLGRIEQSKEIKLAPKSTTPVLARTFKTDSSRRGSADQDFFPSEIKVEPNSPTSPGYTYMDSSSRLYVKNATVDSRDDSCLPIDEVKGFSEKLRQVEKRRESEGSREKFMAMFAQLGDLKVFQKEDISFDKVLGKGQFGEVWKALLLFQGDGGIKRCPVAVKKLRSDEHMPLNVMEEFRNEVKRMASLHHNHIVKLIGVSVDLSVELNDPWIITELMPLGSLNQFIVNHRKTIVEDILLNFAVQIAKGMEFLQLCRIVHRDLAARNVLVESKDRVKVCDFGLSRMFGEKDYYRSHVTNGKALIPVRWYAPESIKEQKFTSQSDVWSYGVTNWEMFELWGSNKEYATPYNDLNPSELLDFLENGGRLEKPKEFSDRLWMINKSCWKYNPDERLSFYLLSCEINELLS